MDRTTSVDEPMEVQAIPRFLLKILRCPACGTGLVAAGDGVTCRNGHVYAVRNGIPRFVGVGGLNSDLTRQTSVAFGSQWCELGTMARVTQADVNLHLPAGWIANDLFRGVVLDVGCGMGRYAALVSESGANVVGMDLSSAVDKAIQLWEKPAFVQADLAAPPFASATFDVVYSFGVLHHLLDWEAGLRSCFDLVKPGGIVLVWVYSERADVLRAGRRALRTISRRLPISRFPLAAMGAVILWATSVLPVRLFGRFSLRPFYSDKSLGQLFVDAHDALIAPSERYLTRPECELALESLDAGAGAVEPRRDGSGWIIWARRPVPPASPQP